MAIHIKGNFRFSANNRLKLRSTPATTTPPDGDFGPLALASEEDQVLVDETGDALVTEESST